MSDNPVMDAEFLAEVNHKLEKYAQEQASQSTAEGSSTSGNEHSPAAEQSQQPDQEQEEQKSSSKTSEVAIYLLE